MSASYMVYMPSTNDVGTGIRRELASGENAFIARGILVSSFDNIAIFGDGGPTTVNVQGTVSAARSAISLGNIDTSPDAATVIVGREGYVATLGSDYAINFRGTNGRIFIEGEVWGGELGILMNGVAEGGKSVLENSGTIRAEWTTVYRAGDEDFVLRNSGRIISDQDGYAFQSSDESRDTIVNSGRMVGNAYLGGNDDLFDGRDGRVEGEIYGQDGNDRLLLGAGDDSLIGGEGNDMLMGGAGADRFVFHMPLDARTNVDRIADFKVREDVIELGNRAFEGLTAGVLERVTFSSGSSGKALDHDDRIIYERDSGRLLFDIDGAGGEQAVLFARLEKNLALSHRDFVVLDQRPSLAGGDWDI